MKKSTTKPTVAKKVVHASAFVNDVLADLNKSEADLQLEKVLDFQANAQISCRTQIGLIETSEIPTLKLQLEQAENKLLKAQKSFAKTKKTLASNFDAYVNNREEAQDDVDNAQYEVDSKKEEITNAEAKLATFKEILADLS